MRSSKRISCFPNAVWVSAGGAFRIVSDTLVKNYFRYMHITSQSMRYIEQAASFSADKPSSDCKISAIDSSVSLK